MRARKNTFEKVHCERTNGKTFELEARKEKKSLILKDWMDVKAVLGIKHWGAMLSMSSRFVITHIFFRQEISSIKTSCL